MISSQNAKVKCGILNKDCIGQLKKSCVICHLRAQLCVEVHVDICDLDGLDPLHHHPAPLSIVTDFLLRISLKTF